MQMAVQASSHKTMAAVVVAPEEQSWLWQRLAASAA
jgi:hypothetical protein